MTRFPLSRAAQNGYIPPMQTRAQSPSLDYITRTFVAEPAWLSAPRAEGERRRAGMSVSAYEGHVLRWLARLAGAKRILEIGTFMGYSTLWLADGLAEGGRLTTLEFDAEHAKAARAHIDASPFAAQVEVAEGDARTWLAAQPLVPMFDLVFIDADKPGYAEYLDAVLPRMNRGGFIIGDNTLLFGVMSGENPEGASASAKASMTRFNETLADASRFESLMLPTAEGLTVARVK